MHARGPAIFHLASLTFSPCGERATRLREMSQRGLLQTRIVLEDLHNKFAPVQLGRELKHLLHGPMLLGESFA